jgi:hypothetical protein
VSKQNGEDDGSVNRHDVAEIDDDHLGTGVDCLLERLGEQIAARVVKGTG